MVSYHNRLIDLKVKIFADTASLSLIGAYKSDPLIQGFTTNPSLMRQQGIGNYEKFVKVILANVRDKPVSFEVFADDPNEMIRQARILSSWGKNVYVKIPVTDTHGRFMEKPITVLSELAVPLNVTAVMTEAQVASVLDASVAGSPLIVSVFAGRIADTGVDPKDFLFQTSEYIEQTCPEVQLLWASCREVLNIFEAYECGCDIITVTPEILAKLALVGKDLLEYSLDTVKQFHRDAKGLSL